MQQTLKKNVSILSVVFTLFITDSLQKIMTRGNEALAAEAVEVCLTSVLSILYVGRRYWH